MRRFLERSTIAAAFALAAFRADAQEVHALSLQEAVAYAKKNNAKIRNAMIDVQIQQQTNKALTADALPKLNASGSITDYFNVPVTPFPDFISPLFYQVLSSEGVKDGNGNTISYTPEPTKYIAVAFSQKYNATAGVTLTQTIFDGQVFIGLKARKASIDYAQKAVDLTEEQIRVNVHKVYWQLVVGKTRIQQIDANIDRAQKLLHDATAMHDNGFAEQLDVDRATVQLANLQTQKISTQTSIDNGYLGLKYLIGMPMRDSLVLTDNFSEDDIKAGALDDTARRYSDRNDYQALEIEKSLDQYNVRRYKYAYYPTASLNGAFQKNTFSNTFDIFSRGASWFTSSYAGVSVNVPIFNGFSKDANLKKARLQLQQVQNNIDYLKISIDNDVAQAQNNFRSAILTLDYQHKNMQLAESVYNQTKKKYESGLASNTDVSNAQNDLVVAQTLYTSALYDAVIAKVDFLKAIGKL